jgi:hypothetical protein
MTMLSAIKRNDGAGALLLVFYVAFTFATTLHSQSAQTELSRGDSKIKKVETAEVRAIEPGTLFDPEHQREVYWHDSDWKINLVIPASKNHVHQISVQSNSGTNSTVVLPDYFYQIDEILRGPEDKAIVLEEDGSYSQDFAVIDLKQGKLIAQIAAAYGVEISPNRRFVFFQRWVARFAKESENEFGIYDLVKSTRANVCSYSKKDPRHEHLELAELGFPVYPQRPGQTDCSAPDDSNDDNQALLSSWAEDSTKVVFADVKGSVMSLILVTMPIGAKDVPETSMYTLKGAQDVCAGATDAAGDANCDVIKSIGWGDGYVTASFRHQFGTPLNLQLTIPISSFVPIGKSE